MAKRKRTSRQSSLVGRAVKAGRQALREAEKRIPPDLRRQVQSRLKDADKTARAAIKQLETQARKASTRADVNSVLKRIDGLTKQARQVIQGTATRAATTPRRRAASTTRRAATRTKQAVSATRRKVTTRVTAPRRRSAAARPKRMPETTAPDAGSSTDTGPMSET
jgi:hypothetical protein